MAEQKQILDSNGMWRRRETSTNSFTQVRTPIWLHFRIFVVPGWMSFCLSEHWRKKSSLFIHLHIISKCFWTILFIYLPVFSL